MKRTVKANLQSRVANTELDQSQWERRRDELEREVVQAALAWAEQPVSAEDHLFRAVLNLKYHLAMEALKQ